MRKRYWEPPAPNQWLQPTIERPPDRWAQRTAELMAKRDADLVRFQRERDMRFVIPSETVLLWAAYRRLLARRQL